jgi:hypothetical protein
MAEKELHPKEKDWKKSWAQALAEMYAASTQGANICYGVVTTGELGQFGQLEEGKIFTREPIKLSAIENLQKVLNTLRKKHENNIPIDYRRFFKKLGMCGYFI